MDGAQKLIKNFNEERISKSSSQYDVKKLKWFNHQYINKMDDEKYLSWIKKYFSNECDKSEEWLNHLLLIYKSHLNYGKEINELTGLDIKYYIKVDTEAFKALVEAIGGVTFDVPIDMKYTDKKQGLYINLKAGVQKLDGDKAEQVVRFRHNSDGSTYPAEYGIEDIGRMKTQRNFLKALAKQTLKIENIFKINEFIDIAKKYVETNISFDVIKDYVPYIAEFNSDNLRTEHLPGQSEKCNGWWMYTANESKTAKLIDKMFLNPELQDEEIDTSSVDTTGIDKEKIKIEILNGSGSSVKLERIENRLKKAGYTDITTEETSNVDNSVIINRGDVENSAIEELKLLVQTQTVSVGESTDVNITIILGKDK